MRCLEERFLNKVQGIIGNRNETSGEAVQPVDMRLEQVGQSVGLLRGHGRLNARSGPFAHGLLNVWRAQNVGGSAGPSKAQTGCPSLTPKGLLTHSTGGRKSVGDYSFP